MKNVSRIIIGVGALILAAAFFVPFWSIYLIAPQYPEGLSLQIWLNKLSGDVEIINGLNHYIGMKHIKAEMFPEFDFLIYALGMYILLGVIVAVAGKRSLLLGYISLFIVGGAVALIDFYQWGYDYGHDLDPKAAIQVPGLTYQPPLIGHKKLLNFDAFSYPDTGAWIAIAVVIIFSIVWLIEWRRSKPREKQFATTNLAIFHVLIVSSLLISSCKPMPEKIQPGKDACSECRMTIADARFGGEIVTKKGKVYKFDDAHCVAAFLKKRSVDLTDIYKTLFVDYESPHDLIPVKDAEFVISSSFKSPMAGNAAAFRNKDAADKKSSELDGSKVTNWSTLYNILVK